MLRHPRSLTALVLTVTLLGCGSSGTGPSCGAECGSPIVDCGAGGCAAIAVIGDEPATTPGRFKGFADPSLAGDPTVPNRIWFAYSWPHIVGGMTPDSSPVQMAAVSTHLARSDDGGAAFTFVNELWPGIPTADPEGSGQFGLLASETASLTAIDNGGMVTWYGAHLRYFLEPETGYHPRYATSWTVQIGAAASPPALATAPEVVLGVTATSMAYAPDVRLDQLAGLPQQRCALLNNPTLFAQAGDLYLIVECLAFIGATPDLARNTIQVFATTPTGTPSTWVFRYVGQLADSALAADYRAEVVQQPDVSRASDGTLMLLVTPASADTSVAVGQLGDGCVALELTSIDPPLLRRSPADDPVMLGRVTGTGTGACTYSAASSTGILLAEQGTSQRIWSVLISGLMP